ncbi:MAG: hypothetical protein OQK24_06660 [Magnetovibrio sp.]|nr:hypothetical protein [Magnetovibrio sp.]
MRAEGEGSAQDALWDTAQELVHKSEECATVFNDLDKARAIEITRLAILAEFTLGSHLLEGYCMDRNVALAKRAFQYAAQRGNVYAALFLGQAYFMEEGAGSPKAREWAERASNALITVTGQSELKQMMAKRFESSGLSPHVEEAFSWHEDESSRTPNSMYEVGLNLLKLNAYPESKLLACEWFYKAERQGHKGARYQLGRQHALGDGVKVSKWHAYMMLEWSVNYGKTVEAYLLAAQLLQEGEIFTKNLPNAYLALLKAQALGADVSEQLETLEPDLSLEEKKDQKFWAQYETSLVHLGDELPQLLHPACSYSSR